MRIQDMMNNEFLVTSDSEVESILLRRYGNEFNSFWLSGKKGEKPLLLVHVNNDLATLHYFPIGKHPGFYSEGKILGLDGDKDTLFFMNDLTEREEFPNYKVVPFSDALAAAKEFLESPELPPSIEWVEL